MSVFIYAAIFFTLAFESARAQPQPKFGPSGDFTLVSPPVGQRLSKQEWIIKIKIATKLLTSKLPIIKIDENTALIKISSVVLSNNNKLYLRAALQRYLKKTLNLSTEADIEYIEKNSIITVPSNEDFGHSLPVNLQNVKVNKEFSNRGLSQNHLLPPQSIDQFDDVLFKNQWALSNVGTNIPDGGLIGIPGVDINIGRSLSSNKGDKKIIVAILDSGIDYTHPDLVDNIWLNQAEAFGIEGVDDDRNGYIDDIHGYNFVGKNGNPSDDQIHGTHCAGTIAAAQNNQIGISGLLNSVSLMAIKSLGPNGQGDVWTAVAAIEYAIKNKARIISCSWGGIEPSQALKDAFMRAEKAGVIAVVAAGNDTHDLEKKPQYPANYVLNNIVTVTSLNPQNSLSAFSNYSQKFVHIAAPGSQIISTIPNSDYRIMSGTSMAVPYVTGALALLISQIVQSNSPIPSVLDLKNMLINSAKPCENLVDKVQAKGRLDLYNLLNRIYPAKTDIHDWTVYNLPASFESKHPYLASHDLTKVIKIPEAKAIRVVLDKYDFDVPFAYLKIRNPNSPIVNEEIYGSGENRTSAVLVGNSVQLDFKSGTSGSTWGFKISRIEYFK